jgi:hypothetical protein
LYSQALFVLDNAPAYPTYLDEISSNIKVVFLPPYSTSVLQLMDQDVIARLKAFYIRKTFSQAVKITNPNEGAAALRDYWRLYNVRAAIGILSSAWDEMKSKTVGGNGEKFGKTVFRTSEVLKNQ